MFVDALDVQMYSEHHLSGRCYLSLSKVNYSFYDLGIFCMVFFNKVLNIE